MNFFARILSAGILLGALSAPGAHAQDGNFSMADDGSVVPVRKSAARVAANYRPSQFLGRRDERASVPSRLESAAEVWELLGAEPAKAPDSSPEAIIGTDDRVKITDTTVYPHTAIAAITFAVDGQLGQCTGWFISPDTVATAGHCVHKGGGGRDGFYSKRSFRIYPGRNGVSIPFGSCKATRLHTSNRWAQDGRGDFDFGAIKLDCDIGNTVGWFGFFWTPESLLGVPTTIAGYPGDKPLTQWQSFDQVRDEQARRVFYQNDTFGGQSGAPVYYNRATDCTVCGMAIHVAGATRTNIGTRINQQVFDLLFTWRAPL